jgi:hypothetical protein
MLVDAGGTRIGGPLEYVRESLTRSLASMEIGDG